MHALVSVILSRTREGAAVSKDLAPVAGVIPSAEITAQRSAPRDPSTSPSTSSGLRLTSRVTVVAALLLSGCVNVSMTCPDKVSTVTYKGIALTGTTSVSCMPSLNGGYDIEVGGMNLLALAAAVAPLVAAKQPHAGAAEPDPDPLLPPSSTYNF